MTPSFLDTYLDEVGRATSAAVALCDDLAQAGATPDAARRFISAVDPVVERLGFYIEHMPAAWKVRGLDGILVNLRRDVEVLALQAQTLLPARPGEGRPS